MCFYSHMYPLVGISQLAFGHFWNLLMTYHLYLCGSVSTFVSVYLSASVSRPVQPNTTLHKHRRVYLTQYQMQFSWWAMVAKLLQNWHNNNILRLIFQTDAPQYDYNS